MIIAFHGVDHKTGCTMLSQCAAEKLSQQKPDWSVLLLHLTEDPGLDFSPQVHTTMEKYLPFVIQGNADPEDFSDRAAWRKNLFIAGGLSAPGEGAAVHPDMCRKFLKQLESRFDLILLDTGSSLDRGLALGGLISADAVFLIASDGRQSREKFARNRSYYSQLLPEDSLLVINRRGSNPLHPSREKNAWFSQTGYPYLCVRQSSYASAAEEEGKSLLEYKSSGFAKDIRAAAERILALCERKEETKENGRI